MSLVNNAASVNNSNVCPQCQATGLTTCQHAKQNPAPRTPTQKTELGPAASAALLKAAFLGALDAIGYFAWRSGKLRAAETEAEAAPQTPFDEWEPNQ